MVKLYLKSDVLPAELGFCVIECTIARWNRMGSEGYESEAMGEVNITYQELFTPYHSYLDWYKNLTNKNMFL
jgi:hypothetical protein